MVAIQKITSLSDSMFVRTTAKRMYAPIANSLPQWGMPAAITAASVGLVLNNTKNRHENETTGVFYNPKTQELNFSVASKNAEHINLYIFDKPVNGKVLKTVEMTKRGDKWIQKLDKKSQNEIKLDIENNDPVYYGYRAWGPNWKYDKNWQPGSSLGFISHVDENGNRFNPNKLLFDPYAREISHDPISPEVQNQFLDDSVYTTGSKNYLYDTAPIAPKGVFMLPKENVSTGKKPQRALKDDIIYEVHLRGFSKLDKNVPEEYRGTYKGAGMKAKYLKDMGITAVEFLPLQEFDDDRNQIKKNGNYWGYQTINFFAPNKRYAYDKTPGGAIKEFKEMVKAFHDEGIKVCMDVVYNHTGEGGTWGNKDVTSLFSLRGLDNSSYYETTGNGKYFYDNSGCGANMNCASNLGSDLIVNSLKYWSEEMGVDAFRFDLAPVLINTKEKDGYNFNPYHSPVISKMNSKLDIRSQDGKTGSVDLIAEPWACGDGTYQVGRFPSNWSEWNDKFRNIIRGLFNRQEKTNFADVARAISGSDDKFSGNKTRSVNFVTCHDGFTLKDLFSYNNPCNNNPQFKSDGGTQGEGNISWDNFGNIKRQLQAMKNAFLTLMISKGTPMISGGDEIIKTQLGNNNAYCLDTKQNYLNWDLTKTQKEMQDFVKKAAEFRKSHAALRDTNFFNGKDNNNNGLKDVTWVMANGKEAYGKYFDDANNTFLGMRIDGTEYNDSAASVYTAINKGDGDIEINLPKNLDGKKWYLVADTSDRSEISGNFVPQGEEIPVKDKYCSKSRSIMIFIEK